LLLRRWKSIVLMMSQLQMLAIPKAQVDLKDCEK